MATGARKATRARREGFNASCRRPTLILPPGSSLTVNDVDYIDRNYKSVAHALSRPMPSATQTLLVSRLGASTRSISPAVPDPQPLHQQL